MKNLKVKIIDFNAAEDSHASMLHYIEDFKSQMNRFKSSVKRNAAFDKKINFIVNNLEAIKSQINQL